MTLEIDGLEFFKASGSGNDFIIIDDRLGRIDPALAPDLARRLCRRRESVGADGLFLLRPSDRLDFKWQFLNADGSEAEMCGNGGRCVARVAHLIGLCGEDMAFETLAGDIRARVRGRTVRLEMVKPFGLRMNYDIDVDGRRLAVSSLNTGVPHTVMWVDDIEPVDVDGLGRAVRFHREYQPAGTNVNFVKVLGAGELAIRTYERGVEGETLACGTGCVAAALLGGAGGRVKSPVRLLTRGKEFVTVHFDFDGESFTDVFLEGDARIIYRGTLWSEALEVSDV